MLFPLYLPQPGPIALSPPVTCVEIRRYYDKQLEDFIEYKPFVLRKNGEVKELKLKNVMRYFEHRRKLERERGLYSRRGLEM